MPRPAGKSTAIPKYRRHKRSGQAVVTLSYKDHYLGPYDSEESRAKYNRLVGEWLAAGRTIARADDDVPITVRDMVAAFKPHAEQRYRKPGGSRGEWNSYKLVLKLLGGDKDDDDDDEYIAEYADTPAREFGPLALENVRNAMVKKGWSRTYINSQVGRVRRIFRWAAARQLVPTAVLMDLKMMDGLRADDSMARESKPVLPVSEAAVFAVLPHVAPQVRAMIQLQWLNGMRPGEACQMRMRDIDRSSPNGVWEYRPGSHKTQYRGHSRVIHLGPRAQELLRPFVKDDPDAYLFSAAEAERWHREQRTAARRTPLHLGNVPGSNRGKNPKRRPRDRYTVNSYNLAIKRGCEKAWPPPEPLARVRGETLQAYANRLTQEQKDEVRRWRREHSWHPHQLRHTAGTRIRKAYGLEAAQVILGHKSLAATQIYAERDEAAAREVMAEVG